MIGSNGFPTLFCHLTDSMLHQSYTDYSLVNQYWHWGHEMAAHSITHRNNQTYWQTMSPQEWRDEMVGVRRMIAQECPAFTLHLDTCTPLSALCDARYYD